MSTPRLTAALAALSTAAAVHAQTRLYVDASAPPGGNGLSWPHALNDLQAALILAAARSDQYNEIEIRVAQGVYTPDQGTHDRTRSFTINSGVILRGGFIGLLATPATGDPDQNDPARFVSVLSGDLRHNDGPSDSTRADNSFLLMRLSGYSSIIDGFTMRGAAAALSVNAAGTVIKRCLITDNIATPTTVVNPTNIVPIISMNGGILVQCTIAENRSSLGNILLGNNAYLIECTVAGNRLTHDGSVILSDSAFSINGTNAYIDACLITANSSDALCLSTGCGVPLYNCTIADNRADSSPGLSGCAATIYNCIFSRNITTGSGGGGGASGPQVSGYGPYLLNCFLDRGLTDVQATQGSHITGNQTLAGSPGFVNPSGPDSDPTTWQDNDYRLAAGSQCIDHGDSLYIPNSAAHLDIRGLIAIDDPSAPNLGSGPSSIIDIGAFERAPVPCPADFDHSGTITTTDLMNFLSAWLSGNISADVDHSDTLTVHDVLEFIDVWFAGCPA